MRVDLSNVAKGPKASALPPTNVSFHSRAVTLARAETAQRPTVLGLIASGRMRPDSGSVTIDGVSDASALRRRSVLVDAPDVSDPAPDVTVAGIVAEELMFAGLSSHPRAVGRALDEFGLRGVAGDSISTVAPTIRIRMLCELALLRDGVDALVLVAPDRHGGDPNEWWTLMREFAARGLAVLVIAGDASAAAIGASALVNRLDDAPSLSELTESASGTVDIDESPTGVEE